MTENKWKGNLQTGKIFVWHLWRMKLSVIHKCFYKIEERAISKYKVTHGCTHNTADVKHTDVQYTSRAHTHKKLPGPKRGAKVFSVKLPHLRKSRDKVYLKIEDTIYKLLPGGQFSNMNLDVISLTKAIHVLKYIHVSPRNTIRYDKVWARRRVITVLLRKSGK